MYSVEDKIEMMYMYELGYKYVARNEIGSVNFFKKKPSRRKSVFKDDIHGYDTWIIKGNFPITKRDEYKSSKIGTYEWLQWKNKPVKIIDIIGNIELV